MFHKATKTKSKLRLALFGPSGAGKTFTALQIATGIGGSIALIDTEYGSASKYADRFEFDTAEAHNPSIDTLIEIISGASTYSVLVIDSLTHPWQELLMEIDQLAKSKYKGNTWSAWSDGTPKQKRLVRAILSFPGHIIATMRAKTEWTTVAGNNGSRRPQRVGLAPEQGKGIEYEFDMLMEITTDHVVQVIKDRSGRFQDTIIEKPGSQFGSEIHSWLSEGADPPPPSTAQSAAQKQQNELMQWMEGQPFNDDQLRYLLQVVHMSGTTDAEWSQISTEVARRKAMAEAFLEKEPQSA